MNNHPTLATLRMQINDMNKAEKLARQQLPICEDITDEGITNEDNPGVASTLSILATLHSPLCRSVVRQIILVGVS